MEAATTDSLSYIERIPAMPEYAEMCEKGLRAPTKVEGKWWLPGVGPATANVMVVTLGVTKEEVAEEFRSGWDSRLRKPKMSPRRPRAFDLNPQVMAFQSLMREAGLDPASCFCTPLIRFLPDEKKMQVKPSKSLLDLFMPLLRRDVERVKPKIIVCADKLVYDQLVKLPGIKLTEADAYGAWMYNEELGARIYLTKKPAFTEKPEFRERFLYDFRNVAAEMRMLDGEAHTRLPVNTVVVRTADDLRGLVARMRDERRRILSVDCEWHGAHHVDGQLRSLQIAWSDTDAAYIRFMDDQCNYALDVDYREAGRILSEWLDNPKVRYIGHHVSADLVWMHHVLGLEYYGKAIFDSEFALQACDEASELGLDILALRYTTLGKYDLKLILWKKKHSQLCEEGYGYIPDDIMIPYAVADVITVYRAWKPIWRNMQRQKLCRYWKDILGPMVTDVFTYLCLTGIPIDRAKTDEMRVLYNWAKEEFGKEFAEAVVNEADEFLGKLLEEHGHTALKDAIVEMVAEGRQADATQLLDTFGIISDRHGMAVWQHYLNAPMFKVQSGDQMRRWLFDIKEYTPLKSTSLKDQGIPAMDWSKVMEMPEEKQLQFTPAADQATLETLSARNKDDVLAMLLQYKKICTVCTSFLKEGELDDNGELVREQGLHKWLASDDAIHGQLSTTETGRSRSWAPNTLNWSGYVHARLATAVEGILTLRSQQGRVPPALQKYVGIKGKDLPTIRSVSMARPGWCMPEADLQTAEMRGLAFISGDTKFLDMVLGVDKDFAYVAPEYVPEGMDPEEAVVRVAFPDYIELPEDKEKYLYTLKCPDKTVARVTDEMLARNEAGEIRRPRQDMHWNISERAQRKAREAMDKKKDRGAGKVVNFSSSYGGQAASLQRKIESDTGHKVPLEMVEAMLQAIVDRAPVADEWFHEMEQKPMTDGFIRAASGRLRHCARFGTEAEHIDSRTKDSFYSALGRECRNFA